MMDEKSKAIIRPGRVEDAASIAFILRDLGWFAHINEPSIHETEEQIAKHLGMYVNANSHTVLVAESQDGGIIGYLTVHWLPYLFLPAPEGYISELIVLESERNKGIGRMLLDKAKEIAEEHGCWRLMLNNGRHRESYKRRFYAKAGWKEREEMVNFILPLNNS